MKGSGAKGNPGALGWTLLVDASEVRKRNWTVAAAGE